MASSPKAHSRSARWPWRPRLPTLHPEKVTRTGSLHGFLPLETIEELLRHGEEPETAQVRAILDKSLAKQRLELEEAATLLRIRSPELLEELFAGARRLKEEVYGNRIVLFAPLYVGNACVNDCVYCGFRRSNREAQRQTLTPGDLRREIRRLEEMGHKRLILVFGEHPRYSPEFIAETVRLAYGVKKGPGEIRRVNINAAPLDEEGYATVHRAGIGTYQVFQETYHPETYARCHPSGPKSDFLWRLEALDRAQRAGIDDVGIGVLFGLYDWRFEVLALLSHAIHLEESFGVGPHTISFPRFRPAQNSTLSRNHLVSDDRFRRLVAVLRLAVPYTGLILTARERPEIRREVIELGCSQIDAGSRIELGGYSRSGKEQHPEREQFRLGDNRSLDEVMRELLQNNYTPSFCTACYRLGRTGEEFMEFAVPGFIRNFCTPNALLTLKEYLEDYASPETKQAGERAIARVLAGIGQETLRREVNSRLRRVEKGERDLYF